MPRCRRPPGPVRPWHATIAVSGPIAAATSSHVRPRRCPVGITRSSMPRASARPCSTYLSWEVSSRSGSRSVLGWRRSAGRRPSEEVHAGRIDWTISPGFARRHDFGDQIAAFRGPCPSSDPASDQFGVRHSTSTTGATGPVAVGNRPSELPSRYSDRDLSDEKAFAGTPEPTIVVDRQLAACQVMRPVVSRRTGTASLAPSLGSRRRHRSSSRRGFHPAPRS